jgi:hypothetical protein
LKTKRYSISGTGGFLVEIKYEQHISSLSPILRRDNYYEEQDPYIILPQHLPIDECEYLFALYDRTKEDWLELKKRE